MRFSSAVLGCIMGKLKFPCELALPIGLMLMAVSVGLLIKSGLGVTVVSSVPLMLHYTFPFLEFGEWSIVFNIAIMGLAVLLIRRPRTSYIISIFMAVFYGVLIDVFKTLIAPLPSSAELCPIYFALSILALATGLALSMMSRLPLLPNDVLIRDAVFQYRVKYKKAKTIYDITSLTISLLFCFLALGGLRDIGIGTIISAVIMGSCVSFMITRLDRMFIFEPAVPIISKFIQREEKKTIMRRNKDEDCDMYESFPITLAQIENGDWYNERPM